MEEEKGSSRFHAGDVANDRLQPIRNLYGVDLRISRQALERGTLLFVCSQFELGEIVGHKMARSVLVEVGREMLAIYF